MKSVAHTGLASVEVNRSIEVTAEDRSHFSNPGLSAAILANVLWGASFLASKGTLLAWGPFTASALRFVLASLLLLAGMKLFRRKVQTPKSVREWLGIGLVALTGFGALYPLQLAGLKLISSGMSAAIMLSTPLMVVIAGRLFLNEAMTHRKSVAIGIGILGGVILLSGNGNLGVQASTSFIIGSTLTLAASLCLALSVIITRKVSAKLDSASLTFWSMSMGALMLTSSAMIFENKGFTNAITAGTMASWTALLFLALICSAFCFFIWNFALSKASPKEIASTMHLKTPTAICSGLWCWAKNQIFQ